MMVYRPPYPIQPKQGLNKYPVDEVVLHCVDIPRGFFLGKSAREVFSTINRWHVEGGFRFGFGYHQLVMPDGEFFPGRPETMIGAHCIERNRGSLGWLLIESEKVESENGKFSDYFTEAQRLAVRRELALRPWVTKVTGHNDYAAKACPGFKVLSSDWLAP